MFYRITTGTHTITCTATGGNGLYSSASKILVVSMGTVSGSNIVDLFPEENLFTHNNITYVTGADPKNYVRFNDELWRIVKSNGSRLTIMKNTSIPLNVRDSSGNYDNTTNITNNQLSTTYYNTLSEVAKTYISPTRSIHICSNSDMINESTRLTLKKWSASFCYAYNTDFYVSCPNVVELIGTTGFSDFSSYYGSGTTMSWHGAKSRSWVPDMSESLDLNMTVRAGYRYLFGTENGSYGLFYMSNSSGKCYPTVDLKETIQIWSESGRSDDPYLLKVS